MGPARSSSFRLVPRPVVNISNTTPISAKVEMVSLVCTRFKRQGPISKPAMISPTTCGARHLRATRPKNLALSIMIAKSRNTEYIKYHTPSKSIGHKQHRRIHTVGGPEGSRRGNCALMPIACYCYSTMERIFQSLFCICERFFYAASYKGIPAWTAYWQRTLPPAEKLHEILRNYYSFVNISTLCLTLLMTGAITKMCSGGRANEELQSFSGHFSEWTLQNCCPTRTPGLEE